MRRACCGLPAKHKKPFWIETFTVKGEQTYAILSKEIQHLEMPKLK